MLQRLVTFVILAFSVLCATAKITFIAPSPDYWWIANSQNLYSWTCGSTFNEGYTNFTVVVTNDSPAILPAPMAILAIQWDYSCSVLLDTGPSLSAGTGYQLHFADVYNQTHLIASSQKFEIKAFGSAYAPTPSGVAPATVTAKASDASGAPAASATTSAKSGAANSISFTAFTLVGSLMALIGASLML